MERIIILLCGCCRNRHPRKRRTFKSPMAAMKPVVLFLERGQWRSVSRNLWKTPEISILVGQGFLGRTGVAENALSGVTLSSQGRKGISLYVQVYTSEPGTNYYMKKERERYNSREKRYQGKIVGSDASQVGSDRIRFWMYRIEKLFVYHNPIIDVITRMRIITVGS